ncbi:leucine-rich repeat-containing protein 40 [Scaptodrosophila lebanonensis]|uniref:Leucine-rich repeat-containing protein 40 n=1 Tax=Drosophila lebanonensis TaxID=7225 RepID=A0A6J2TVQ1_DROLE|nr:leucine-rich repeat-containing protein 40 [Scaptodrosophila lebanonensis]
MEGMVGDGLNSPRVQGGKDALEDNSICIPDKYTMRNTRVLSVMKAQLEEVPDDLLETARAEHVTVVNFEGNLLHHMPRGLQHLSDQLSELVLAKNQIAFIPACISQFSRLSVANFSCNLLRNLPNEFGALQMLCELDISHNRLDKLPLCIGELQNLEVLLANDNHIRELNASESGLGGLKRLITLDLRNNDIDTVPPVLGNLTNIKRLKLTGNPFRQPRHQILSQGTAAIMEYLRGRIPASASTM